MEKKLSSKTVDELLCLAKKGNGKSQKLLGDIYEEGKLVPRSPSESYYWYTKAAENNNADAQYELAQIYLKNNFVKKDYYKAFKRFKIAANQGCEKAYVKVAYMCIAEYYIDEGIYWYNKAIKKKNTQAMYELGRFYMLYFPNYRDPKKGLKLISQAAKLDNAEAQLEMGTIYKNGDTVKKDIDEAIYWFSLAIRHGNKRIKKNAKEALAEVTKHYRNN